MLLRDDLEQRALVEPAPDVEATAVLLSEVFPTAVRYTASVVTYNVAYALFGGTAPFVATLLIAKTGSNLAPAGNIVVVSVIAVVAALSLPETSRQSLDAANPCARRRKASTGRLGMAFEQRKADRA